MDIMDVVKYFYENKVEIIEADKLVPINGYSFDLFKGRRLTEMIDSVRTFQKICYPIYVRPVQDGKYEVIDGYYRTIAAKELKIKTVPAIVLYGLTDEYAISLISDSNPIGLQLHYGVDIYNIYYKGKESYKNIEQLQFFPDEHCSISYDLYIERYLLDDSDVCKTYESKYDMGYPYKLPSDECEYRALAKEICGEEELNVEEYELKLVPSMDNSDWARIIASYNAAKDDYNEKIDKAAKILTRKDGNSYTDQLKRHFNFDLDLFDYNNIRNRQERIKILYLIYKIKNYEFPKVKVLELLSKPSMENIDTSPFGWKTNNGYIIKYIKNAVEKELTVVEGLAHPLDIIDSIRRTVDSIADTWNQKMIYYIRQMEILALLGHDFEADINYLKSIVIVFPIPDEKSSSSGNKTTSPLEEFYFRLLQYEYLGQVMDMLKIIDLQMNYKYDVPPEYIEEMKEYQKRLVDKDGVEKFFELENVRKIAKYVYLKLDVTKNERRKIRNSKDKVIKIISFRSIFKGEDDIMDGVTELFIISCLQAIILDENKVFDYTYSGYEGQDAGNRKGKKQIQAALKNDKNNFDALKIYWTRNVADRNFANIGNSKYRKNLKDVEKVIYGMMEKIFNCPTIDEMKNVNKAYSKKFDVAFSKLESMIELITMKFPFDQ